MVLRLCQVGGYHIQMLYAEYILALRVSISQTCASICACWLHHGIMSHLLCSC